MIWTFKSNEAKETSDVNLAPYKLTGKVYEDAEQVCKLMGVHVHPALRPVLWKKEKIVQYNQEGEEIEPEVKPVTIIKFDKHRIDKNTIKALFHVIPSSTVKTLKFWNNGITPSQFSSLIEHLNQAPTIQTVFFDWNPIYKEDFRILDKDQEVLYERAEDEPSKFASFVAPESRIKILFLRGNNLNDSDLKQICNHLKDNVILKVLDVSYNNLTKTTIDNLKELICDHNKTLEFIGLAKNNLKLSDIQELIDCIGKKPFPEEEAEAYIKKMKERDAIVEKNKKLKASKKPEEPVPLFDDIEQQEDGSWVMVQNGHIRHLNLCMNPIGDESQDAISDLLKRTPNEFSITLSGTNFSKDVIELMWSELNTEENPDLGKQRLLF